MNTVQRMVTISQLSLSHEEKIEAVYEECGLDALIRAIGMQIAQAPDEATIKGGLAFLVQLGIIAGQNIQLPSYMEEILRDV